MPSNAGSNLILVGGVSAAIAGSLGLAVGGAGGYFAGRSSAPNPPAVVQATPDPAPKFPTNATAQPTGHDAPRSQKPNLSSPALRKELIGMSMDEVRAKLGPPDQSQAMINSAPPGVRVVSGNLADTMWTYSYHATEKGKSGSLAVFFAKGRVLNAN